MKKTIIYSALLAVLVAVGLNSCKKDDDIAANSSPTAVVTGLRGSDCGGEIKTECGILKFADMAHFTTTYECLKSETAVMLMNLILSMHILTTAFTMSL